MEERPREDGRGYNRDDTGKGSNPSHRRQRTKRRGAAKKDRRKRAAAIQEPHAAPEGESDQHDALGNGRNLGLDLLETLDTVEPNLEAQFGTDQTLDTLEPNLGALFGADADEDIEEEEMPGEQ